MSCYGTGCQRAQVTEGHRRRLRSLASGDGSAEPFARPSLSPADGNGVWLGLCVAVWLSVASSFEAHVRAAEQPVVAAEAESSRPASNARRESRDIGTDGATAAVDPRPTAARSESPLPWQDDATLRAVQSMGSRSCLAVGDHGAVWRSGDGGDTWTWSAPPGDTSWRSISFITPLRGWIAGFAVQPMTQLTLGVIAHTTDGGASWTITTGPASVLPGVLSVRFFDTESGLAATFPSTSGPSGVWQTLDGGLTWKPLSGPSHRGWSVGQFSAADSGALIDREGQFLTVAQGQVLSGRLPSIRSRRLRGMMLGNRSASWLVGDGGLLLTSETGGRVWQASPAPLPDGAQSLFDLAAVAQKGTHVWVAGRPGSVIWRSRDNGSTWEPHVTGQTAPLWAMQMQSEQLGIAVGELGLILKTRDGGARWQAVRAADRRAAALWLVTSPQQLDLGAIAKWSGELGYRTVVSAPVHRSVDDLAATRLPTDEQLLAAVAAARGTSAHTGWRLDLDRPGLEQHPERLLAEWQQQTDGRLSEAVVGDLVRDLRTWRPTVVVIPAAAPDDPVSQLVHQAALAAVHATADATRYPDHLTLAGLSPWTVDRVWEQQPEMVQGELVIDPQEFLPRWSRPVAQAAERAQHLLHRSDNSATFSLSDNPESDSETERPVRDSDVEVASFRWLNRPAGAATGRDPWAGAGLSPGSAARRQLGPIDDDALPRHLAAAKQRRQLDRLVQHQFRHPPTAEGFQPAAQLMAMLPELLEGQSSEDAATVLWDLAQNYVHHEQWDSAESTMLELVRREPQTPAALAAMRWLLTYWTSLEVSHGIRQQQRSAILSAEMPPSIQRALATQPVDDAAASPTLRDRLSRVLPGVKTVSGNADDEDADTASIPSLRDFMAEQQAAKAQLQARHVPLTVPPQTFEDRLKRAQELVAQLQQQSPRLFEEAEIQFPLAALHRAAKSPQATDGVYRRFQAGSPDDLLRQLAERELWVGRGLSQAPARVAVCRATSTRPQLDGLFSDSCWEAAQELSLTTGEPDGPDGAQSSHGLVMTCYDQTCLYWAVSIPRHRLAPADRPATEGRTYDAPLGLCDRWCLALDCDRDYTTWYDFQVDQRGWTNDRCWTSSSWNPDWFVAAAADDERWRVEIAIPWTSLGTSAPEPRTAWAMALSRVVPGVLTAGWQVTSPTWPPPPGMFNLLRFD
jgi:photosystem II stability/assembly factor-like uncharacterized protein